MQDPIKPILLPVDLPPLRLREIILYLGQDYGQLRVAQAEILPPLPPIIQPFQAMPEVHIP